MVAQPAVVILPMVESFIPVLFCFSDTRFYLLSRQGNQDDSDRHLFLFADYNSFIHHSSAPGRQHLLPVDLLTTIRVIPVQSIAQARDKESLTVNDAGEHPEHKIAQVAEIGRAHV